MNYVKKLFVVVFSFSAVANAQNAYEGFIPPEPVPVVGPANPAVEELYRRLSNPDNMGTFEINNLMINKQLDEIRRQFALDKCAYTSPDLFPSLIAKAEQLLNAQKILLSNFEAMKASSGAVVVPHLYQLLDNLRNRVKIAEETLLKVNYLEYYNVSRCRRFAPPNLHRTTPMQGAF